MARRRNDDSSARVVLPEGTPVPPEGFAVEPPPAPAAPQPIELEEVGDLEQLADAAYQDWSWYVYRFRSSREFQEVLRSNPKARQRVLATKIQGPLDVMELRESCGGGVYEIWGFLNKQLKIKQTHEIEGPPRSYAEPAPEPAPPAATPEATTLASLAQSQARMAEVLTRLEARVAQPAAANGLSLKDLRELVPLFANGGQPSHPELVSEMVGMFRQGMDLGAQASGNTRENDTLGTVLEKLAPVAERVATALLARRPGPPAPPMRAAAPAPAAPVQPEPVREASTAEVVDAPQVSHRWLTAVDAFAEAIAAGDEPGDFAITLERILDGPSVAMLKLANASQVMEQLAPFASTHGVLASPDAHAFVEAVLMELRNPSEASADPV